MVVMKWTNARWSNYQKLNLGIMLKMCKDLKELSYRKTKLRTSKEPVESCIKLGELPYNENLQLFQTLCGLTYNDLDLFGLTW